MSDSASPPVAGKLSAWLTGLRRLAPSTFVLLAIGLVLAASATALVMVYRTGGRIIDQRERAEALAERDLLAELDQEQGLANLVSSVARRSRYSVGGERYGLFNETGAPLAGDIVRFEPGFTDADWRIVRIAVPEPASLHVVTTVMPDGARLVVGRDLSNIRRFERSILDGFLASLGIVAVSGLVAGYILNARMLRRVDAIAFTAERIAAGDLSARTPIADPRDPFGRVGVSLNAMLERIEELMTGMRTVTDSLAHDLRSPLTRMKGALARALSPGASEADRLDAIEDAHDQVDHTLATLSAMLDIARAETGLSREMMLAVDVAALTAEVADFFAPVIEDAGQTLTVIEVEKPVVALAHEALLRQAIGNLLHNAAQYAGEGARVVARVEGLGDRVEITIADTGEGVSADQRGRVQERFVRLDPARSVGGSGLGLAIATACAKLHGGRLRLEDNHPGLKVVMEIVRGPEAI
jgi:signal transduction histidine kinase